MGLLGFGRRLDEDTRVRMAAGTAMHRQFQQELADRGLLVRAEVTIRDPGLLMSGRIDAVIHEGAEAVPLEYKTVNPARFAQMRQEGPVVSHWAQLALYLACPPRPFSHGVLVVDERAPAGGRLVARQPAGSQFADWVVARVQQAWRWAEDGVLPPREPALHCLDCDRWERCYRTEDDRAAAVEAHPAWEPSPAMPWEPIAWESQHDLLKER